MFARVAALAVLALPLAVSAAPGYGAPSNNCNVAGQQCCNQVGTAKSLAATNAGLASILNAVVGPVTAIVGIQCTPISVLSLAGNSCSAQPVCCTGNQFNGVVNVGCTPLNVNA